MYLQLNLFNFQITDIKYPEFNVRNSSSFLNQSFAETSAGSNFNMSGLNNSTMCSGSPESVQNEGDPDKMLICTYEVAWLVRMFHDISNYVNREVRNTFYIISSCKF
jgi:hypothetical protein